MGFALARPPTGHFLVHGVGAALVALLSLGATFAAVAVESDPHAARVTQACFQNVVLWGDVHTFVRSLRKVLVAVKFSVVGNSPCHEASQDCNEQGPKPSRPCVLKLAHGVAHSCRTLVRDVGLNIPVLTVLEAAQGASPNFTAAASAAILGHPLRVHACSFAWVSQS